tara:strand:- start:3122 stop:3949 length:828 start_codon:yes stop_codon:yes gene_type:complete
MGNDATLTCNTGNLQRVLELTTRKQAVSGKMQEQVVACVLRGEGDSITTTSLVRDGCTSVATFGCDGTGTATIPIPDIARLQGVLNAHGQDLTIVQDGSKIRVKSGRKTTTLLADMGGLAFPHSTETVGEWEEKSRTLMGQVDPEGSYTLRDGSKREAFFSLLVDGSFLFEALRCDNINGQRLNRYTFTMNEDAELTLTVGDELKGRTTTQFEMEDGLTSEAWETTVEGGLESILKHYSGDVWLHFLDFRPEGQGIRMVLNLGLGDYVFQAAVIN